MRTYGRVHTAFWTDTKVRTMSERARTLAFYLLTSPHSNMVGAFLLPDAYVADDLGWSLTEVSKTIRELIENGFCKRFSDGRHIAVCKFLSYNPVESSGSGKSIARQFNQLPRDSALIDTVQLLKQQFDRLPESFANDLEMIPGTTSTSTSQEQAQANTQARDISDAPSQALTLVDDPVLISLPTNISSKPFFFRQSKFEVMAPLYPGIDLGQELRAMAAWLFSNPKNAKTHAGMMRFINGWLSKTQNRSGTNGYAKQSANNNRLAGAADLAAELRSE